MSASRGNDDVIPFETPSSAPAPSGLSLSSRGVGTAGPGQRLGAPSPTAIRCSACGYSMAGLRSLRCPECGHTNRTNPMARGGVDDGVRAYRRELTVTCSMLAIGFIGSALIFMSEDGPIGVLIYLIAIAISVPFGLLAYILCCLMWIGFDAPLRVVALKLAAIYVVVDFLSMGMAMIPGLNNPLLVFVVVVGTYMGLLMKMLDLGVGDAIGVAIVTGLLKIVAAFLIAAMVLPLFA